VGGLKNGDTRDDDAMRKMALAFTASVGVRLFSQTDLGLEHFQKLLYLILLGTKFFKGSQDVAQIIRCFVIREPIYIPMHILFHGWPPNK